MLATTETISAILVNLIAVFLVYLARLLGLDVIARAIRFSRLLPMCVRRLTGARTIVIFTDCDDELHTTRALAASIEEDLKASGTTPRLMIMRDGQDLVRCPFPTLAVMGIIILLTDVTQFSPSPRDRVGLQKRLYKYVDKGGCLILGHDVIYRRTRNEQLQKLAGCVADKSHRTENQVEYEKVTAGPRATTDMELLAALPDSLELTDNEVIIGTWQNGVEYLYHWRSHDSNDAVPLVTRRTVGLGKGRVYWVNSGDTDTSGPPLSLSRPEEGLVTLLATLVRH